MKLANLNEGALALVLALGHRSSNSGATSEGIKRIVNVERT